MSLKLSSEAWSRRRCLVFKGVMGFSVLIRLGRMSRCCKSLWFYCNSCTLQYLNCKMEVTPCLEATQHNNNWTDHRETWRKDVVCVREESIKRWCRSRSGGGSRRFLSHSLTLWDVCFSKPFSQRIIHGTWWGGGQIWQIKKTAFYDCEIWCSLIGFKWTVGPWQRYVLYWVQ